MTISEGELRQLTERYWIDYSPTRTEWYIENLLGKEMEYAKKHTKQPQKACHTLALLVGYSPDPLLQTICVYQPKRIFLVLNDKYGQTPGRDMAINYQEWIELMVEEGLLPSNQAVPDFDQDIVISPESAKPDWIFEQLCEALLPDQQAGKSIVVDITGSKKNMASGAFLFASYVGAEINYVDFEEYNERNRRPYGYSCNIGPQPNLVRAFGLRDWEQVRRLYSQFAFGGVRQELKRLSGEIPFSGPQSEALDRLYHLMGLLEAWDSGDFTHAWSLWSTLPKGKKTSLQDDLAGLELPLAVKVLGQNGWPSATNSPTPSDYHREYHNFKTGRGRPTSSLFNKPKLLLVYAHDELDKIERLIRFKEDHRSALLRAAGLDELLLKARVTVLWFTNRLEVDGRPLSSVSRTQRKRIFEKLAGYSGANNLRQLLQDPEGKYLGIKSSRQVRLTYSSSARHLALDPYWNGCEIDHQTMVNLRNEAIHTALSVSEPMASEALEIARRGLGEFKKKWARLLSPRLVVIDQLWNVSWEETCQACGVNFLPKLQPTVESLLKAPQLLLSYVHDELDKIARLAGRKESHRSMFLRAAGLDELLLKARVAILWLANHLHVDGLPLSKVSTKRKKQLFGKLANDSEANHLRRFLQDTSSSLEVKKPCTPVKLTYSSSARHLALDPYWNGCGIDHQTMMNFRNEASHTVSRADAKAAYEVVKKALEEFECKWVGLVVLPSPTH